VPIKSSIQITTRMSDLDSLRHVNNRIYEQFCAEGRYRLLAEQGHPIEALIDRGITLRPVATFARFSHQQRSGVTLSIETEAFPLSQGFILWKHAISQGDGSAVCEVQARTQGRKRNLEPVDLWPATDEDPAVVLIEDIPSFSGRCMRVASPYSVIYTDMDVFGTIPIAAWWRMFEEGRHMFGAHVGLTLGRLVGLDTHIFWIAGTYRFDQVITAGQQVTIHTWLERVAGIRAHIRQEIRTPDGAGLLGASREEHLIVSLSRARPKAMPPEMAAMMQDYVEYPD
jgi:acyl-CoA thioesterase FadM